MSWYKVSLTQYEVGYGRAWMFLQKALTYSHFKARFAHNSAMFCRNERTDEAYVALYFSPAAARNIEAELLIRAGAPCDPPPVGGTVLLVGDSSSFDMLKAAQPTGARDGSRECTSAAPIAVLSGSPR